jgi:NADH-quinone oxidoreductase subunit C
MARRSPSRCRSSGGRPSAASRGKPSIDWKEQGREVVCRVDNLDARLTVLMRARAADDRCPTLTGLWRGADWMERECYDMFGIRFDGHPDLRRILLGDDWVGHPLLKSYAVDTPHPPYR